MNNFEKVEKMIKENENNGIKLTLMDYDRIDKANEKKLELKIKIKDSKLSFAQRIQSISINNFGGEEAEYESIIGDINGLAYAFYILDCIKKEKMKELFIQKYILEKNEESEDNKIIIDRIDSYIIMNKLTN